MRRRRDRFILLLAMTAMLALALPCGADEPSQEYKVKAAFIYNFARFVEWPSESFASADAPFVIAVVGTDPFNGALEQAVAGKKVGTRRVEIRHFDSIDKIGSCQILFVATTDDDSQVKIIHKVENDHVLTVGESDNFDSNGGSFRFFMEDNKVHFEVNTDAADLAKLRVSSKLLKLARIFKK
jgi:hypothetical protein